ncbi:MAG TPA: beta-galactosidase trimerization domain-containing protein [Acidobacteriaceae bacterium]|nr:beta-galactosidase trimerization domain-containing protein [Acidobacteriaceae bacterium]
MTSTRRTFLKHAAGFAAAGFISLEGTPVADAAVQSAPTIHPGAEQAGWYSRPMRWAQLAFVEDDPGNYDLAFWLDYFRKIHADAACLSAGGVVAFYPTEIPLHYRSKWLGNRDSFGDIAAGCRKLGMNVVARTDSHACHQDAYDAHPDWIMVDAHGNKRRHPSDPTLWLTCALGPYNFDFMTSVHQEIMSKYMVDGIFTNRWAGSGMCYCEHCAKNFRDFSGLDLPRTSDPQDPSRRQYIVWHQQRLFELWRLWNAKIQAINPQASYIANAGGGALSELDMKTIGELAPTLFADRQARRGLMPPWTNGKNGKEYRATMGNKAIVGIFSVGLEEEYRWKDSVQNGDEIRLWVADGISQDLRPWFTKFNAKLIDRRWLPVVEEIYTWHHSNEDYLRNERSFARVGMVYSQQTASFYGGPKAQAKVADPALGFYEAMVEARIPFEMVHDHLLDIEHIDQFRTLILPNVAALSTAQCDQLRAFVDRGGSIVATYETSLYDEWGVRREDFGLSQLFGASFAGSTEGPMLNSYLTLEKDPSTGKFHPLLTGFEDATRIIDSVYRVRVKPAGESLPSPLEIVPSYPDLPMEEVFPKEQTTHDAGVFLRQAGRGRVVYFPGDIDRTFWDVLDVDHAKLLRNAVLWATDEPAPVTVEGKGVLDISVWGQKKSMTVHLVNLTNPMMMKGPVREIIPVSKQQLRIQIPAGRRVTKARLLVAGQEVQFHLDRERVLLEVPSIGVHEVVALDLSV